VLPPYKTERYKYYQEQCVTNNPLCQPLDFIKKYGEAGADMAEVPNLPRQVLF
jgi:hypothetical protein